MGVDSDWKRRAVYMGPEVRGRSQESCIQSDMLVTVRHVGLECSIEIRGLLGRARHLVKSGASDSRLCRVERAARVHAVALLGAKVYRCVDTHNCQCD